MSDHEISQSEQPPSQPSTSHHLQVVIKDEFPGLTAPWVLAILPCPVSRKRKRTNESGNEEDDLPGVVDAVPWVESGLMTKTTGQKRKRESSSESENKQEDLEELDGDLNHPWDGDSLCGLKMKLKKRRKDMVGPEHHQAFTRLLEDPVVKRFLAWDMNLRVSDKSHQDVPNPGPFVTCQHLQPGLSSLVQRAQYLLSMVIAYFSRAGLFSWQYQRIHFFLALYLANDMEEDNEVAKQDIFYFLYGRNYAQRPLFHKLRYQFFCSMGYSAWVSREECEAIQAYDPDLWVWRRDRTLIPSMSWNLEA